MEISVYVQNFKNQFRNTQESFVIAAKTYYEALKEHGEEAERAFHSQFKLTKKTWVLLEQVGRGIIPVELVFHAKFPYAKYAVKLSPQKCKQLLEVGYVDYTIGVHDHRQVRLPDMTKEQCKIVFDTSRNTIRSIAEQRAYISSITQVEINNRRMIAGTHLDARKVKISEDGSGDVKVNGYHLSREMLIELLNASTASMNRN